MKTVRVECDEEWPYYRIDDECYDFEIEVDDEQYKWIMLRAKHRDELNYYLREMWEKQDEEGKAFTKMIPPIDDGVGMPE